MWKTCKRFPLYEVNEHGDVRNKDTQKILKQRINGKGYLRVNLVCDKGRKTVYSYRLVAEAFIPNPKHLPCVNHKDENKLNNDVSNLEWCTIEYNNRYGSKTRRQYKPIYACYKDIQLGFESLNQAAEVIGCAPSTLCNAIRKGEITYFKGLYWCYIEDTPTGKSDAHLSNNEAEKIIDHKRS